MIVQKDHCCNAEVQFQIWTHKRSINELSFQTRRAIRKTSFHLSKVLYLYQISVKSNIYQIQKELMAKTIERSLLNLYSEHLKEKLANLQVMKLPKNLKKCKNISKMHHSKIQILFQTVICSNLSRINVNGWLNEVNWDKILMIKH